MLGTITGLNMNGAGNVYPTSAAFDDITVKKVNGDMVPDYDGTAQGVTVEFPSGILITNDAALRTDKLENTARERIGHWKEDDGIVGDAWMWDKRIWFTKPILIGSGAYFS